MVQAARPGRNKSARHVTKRIYDGASKKSKRHAATKVYITHDNGGRPFCVKHYASSVDVYKRSSGDNYNTTYDVKLHSFRGIKSLHVGGNRS